MSPNPKTIHILVDHREADSGVPESLATLPRVQIEWQQLDEGDYVAGDLAIERKTSADLSASISDRRLFAQVQRLQERFGRVVVLVEGESLYTKSRLHPNAVRGAASYLAVLAGVSLVPSIDAADSAALIATMARHALHGLGYELNLHHKPHTVDPQLSVRYLVEQLPGIGPTLAEALLTHFGTARKLFTATYKDIMAVPGIGPQRAREIDAVLNRSYTETRDPRPAGARVAKEEV